VTTFIFPSPSPSRFESFTNYSINLVSSCGVSYFMNPTITFVSSLLLSDSALLAPWQLSL